MEYPHGHHSHNSHRNDDDDEENNRQNHPPPQRPGYDNHPPPQRPGFDDYPPPQRPGFNDYPPFQRPGFEDYPPPQRPGYDQPPPPYRGGEDRYGSPPPPRPTAQVYHSSHAAPPQAHSSAHYGFSDPPPQAHSGTTVHHVAHEPDPDRSPEAQSHRPHLPGFMHHKPHESSGYDLSSKPTYKVYCKADPNLHLTVRDDKVVLAPSDPNNQHQNWYKDEKFSTRVKDKEGFPSFALVNKATGQAVKHSVAASHPVQLAPYNANVLDQSVLWTESRDLGDGYRTVRMVNNIKLSVDAFQGNGVGDGTTVGVWEWNRGNNQRWKITLHCKLLDTNTWKEMNSTRRG